MAAGLAAAAEIAFDPDDLDRLEDIPYAERYTCGQHLPPLKQRRRPRLNEAAREHIRRCYLIVDHLLHGDL